MKMYQYFELLRSREDSEIFTQVRAKNCPPEAALLLPNGIKKIEVVYKCSTSVQLCISIFLRLMLQTYSKGHFFSAIFLL